MTNLFGFNITNAFSVKSGSDAFVCKTLPADLLDKIATLQPQAAATRRKALLLSTVFCLSMLTIILIPLGIIVLGYRFSAVLQNTPWVFALEGTAFVVWISILLYALQYKKRSRTFTPYGAQSAAEVHLTEACRAALGIPANAAVVDVLAEVYFVDKDGVSHHKEHTLTGVPLYHNLPTPVFADDEALYLSDFTRLIRIPLASLCGATTSSRRVALQNWNKAVSPHAEAYRSFDIRQRMHCFAFYCQIEINDPRGAFCLLVPTYDAGMVLQLIEKYAKTN